MYEKNLSRNDQSDIYEKPIRKWSIAQLVQDERTLFLTNFSVHCPILMKFLMHSYESQMCLNTKASGYAISKILWTMVDLSRLN